LGFFEGVLLEKYVGTKFETIFLKNKVGFSVLNAKKLIYWAKIFSKNNLAPSYAKGSSGNLSFRSKKGFVITPTAMFFEKLKPKDLAVVENFDFGKNTVFVRGTKVPSSETPMHFLIYKKRKDVAVVLHFHDNLLLEKAKELKIPCSEKEFPYGSIDLAKETAKLLSRKNFACIKGHGFVCAGKDFDSAGKLCLEWHEKALIENK